MQIGKKITFLEVNQLCPDLLAAWMTAGKLPNFKRFHDASHAYTARVDVEDPDLLESWPPARDRFSDEMPADAQIQRPDGGTIPFHEVFYRIPYTKSGAHHPDNLLWFKTGRASIARDKVSILDVFPTLLDDDGADPARVPGPPRTGRSLLFQLGLPLFCEPAVAMAAG